MTTKIAQKVAWITGASSGIGAATAEKLAKEGWKVAITARSAGKLDVLADKDPQFIKAFPGDVTNADQMTGLVEEIETTLGPIELAILNAGTFTPDHIEEFTTDNFDKHVQVNLSGTAHCLAPVMHKFLERRRGHIAITSSVAGYRGLPKSISYGATKAALINMAEAVAIECYNTNIKVQVICPGFVKTPLTDQNDFDMPMRIEVDKAADELIKGLKSSRFEILFPWQFCLLVKLVDLLPDKLYFKAMYQMKKNTKGKETSKST